MPDSVRHAFWALRRWAGYFFQPCPNLVRTVAGAALAAVIAACLLLVFHLSTGGWSQTIALLPKGIESSLRDIVTVLTPDPPALQNTPQHIAQHAPWRAPWRSSPSSMPEAPVRVPVPDVPALPPLRTQPPTLNMESGPKTAVTPHLPDPPAAPKTPAKSSPDVASVPRELLAPPVPESSTTPGDLVASTLELTPVPENPLSPPMTDAPLMPAEPIPPAKPPLPPASKATQPVAPAPYAPAPYPGAPAVPPFHPDQSEKYRGGVNTFVRAPLRSDTLPYLDLPNVSLSEAIKQVDYALTQTMLRLDLGWNAFQLISHERRLLDITKVPLQRRLPGMGDSYLMQRLRVYLPLPRGHTPEAFTTVLNEMLTIWSERASLYKENNLRLTVQVDGVVTHELFLSPEPRKAAGLAAPAPGTPLLTIVIDDMGASTEAAQRLLALGLPVTLSIWPRAVHAARVAEMAWGSGQEVLIHQPTEPLDFPVMQPGPGAVFVRMPRTEIAAILRDNIGRIPHAVGINNHMGSRFTTDRAAVDVLCSTAAEQGLFVLDSLTNPRSILANQAVQHGIAAYRRAVFLDDPLNKDAIRAALRDAEQAARKHGQAIAIGHPHPETLDALYEWARTRDTGIQIVPLRNQRPLF